MMNKVVAIIPARGGSKGIFKKNIRDFGGRPLICWQIDNAQKSKYIEHVVIATDDPLIARIANEYDIEIVWRPEHISHELSKTEETIIYVLNRVSAEVVVILEPTNPLLKVSQIDECINKVANKGFDSCCLAVEDYSFRLDDLDLIERPMRQHKTPHLKEAGGCWAIKTDTLLKTNNRLGGKLGHVIIPAHDATHIDDEDDWKIAEALLDRPYFTRRAGSHDYKEYWADSKVDPDGQVRRRQDERDLYLSRNKTKLNYINQHSGSILDVGCGLGFLLSGVDEKFDKFGLEIDPKAVEIAAEYGQIFQGKLEDAHYVDNFFDIVVLNHVIEHVEDPVGLIKEVRRILRPRGRLILETPDFGCGVAQRFGQNFRLLHDPGHISLFGQFGVYQLLRDNLFEVEGVDYPYFETDYFNVENFNRLFDTTKVSPPFLGSVVTFYCYVK